MDTRNGNARDAGNLEAQARQRRNLPMGDTHAEAPRLTPPISESTAEI